MSQVTDYDIPASPLTMTGLKTALEAIFDALGDDNRGATAPPNPFEGMIWQDTSGTPTELIKKYTVAAGWVTLFSINITTGVVTPYRAGVALGTMSVEAAANYVTKALFDAQSILAATTDNTPGAVTVAADRVVGRKAGGNIDDLTLSEILDFIGSPAQGDILYRDSSAWARLPKGAAGQGLKMNSTATAPEWGTMPGRMNVLAKTGAYTLTAGDSGKLVTCSGTFTLSAEAAATLGDGWWVAFKNIGTGVITFNPDGSEVCYSEFNTTFTSAGLPSSCFIVCNGTSFFLVANSVSPNVAGQCKLSIPTELTYTTTSTSYAKLLELYVPKPGSLRIKFTLWSNSASVTAYARIYRNGIAIGTERSNTATNTIYSEDISGWSPGDLLQIYAKVSASGTAYVGSIQVGVDSPCNVSMII